jgi:hypothetical protein
MPSIVISYCTNHLVQFDRTMGRKGVFFDIYHIFYPSGYGPKWNRTTHLTLIRRAL